VCLSENKACDNNERPVQFDILVGLNYDLNPRKDQSGQIYFQQINSASANFNLAKTYVNLLKQELAPTNVFMITYNEVTASNLSSTSRVSFQIFLLADKAAKKYFVTYKYKSCPTDLTFKASSGLNYKNYDGSLIEIVIDEGKQCTESNVRQTGVWTSDVTSLISGNNNYCPFYTYLPF
jgi:hypothetical protein